MQTSCTDYVLGVAGMIADGLNAYVESFQNGVRRSITAEVAKTPTTASAAVTTTITIDGTAFTVTHTAGATATVTEIADDLIDVINADSAASSGVYASNSSGIITITADFCDNDFSAKATANICAITTVTYATEIPFGKGVCRSTQGNDYGRLPAAAADVTSLGSFLGICVKDNTVVNDSADAVQVGATLTILSKGNVYVEVESAVTPATVPYCRYTNSTANGNWTVGNIRGDADTATATIIPNAKFMSTAAAGGVAILRLS